MDAPLDKFRRARPLLLDLAADIHPERWEALGVPAAGAARLAACPRARASLSARLDWLGAGAETGLAAWAEWAAALDARPGKWALLPGHRLWRAALRLGAGRHRAGIVRLVRREDLDRLKAAAGEDARRFALRQAPLAWPGAPLEGDPDPPPGEPLIGRLLGTAGLGLGCWLAALPAGLAGRARAKLPLSGEPRFRQAAQWPPERRGRWLAALERAFALERA